jgi:endonuclease/exonuclease/phosphatase family metal-dependent hydrolase
MTKKNTTQRHATQPVPKKQAGRPRRPWLHWIAAAMIGLSATPGIQRLHAEGDSANEDGLKDLSVVTWNIEWYPGKKNYSRGSEMVAHAAIVQRELKKIDPDIFLAQEMRDWNSFARLTDVVRGLRPAVVSAFTSRRSGEYWRQQLGIASKWPVTAAWSERWSMENDIQPPRGFAAAVIDLPGEENRRLLVYSLHLKSNLSDDEETAQKNFKERDESIRQLLAHMRDMKANAFADSIIGVIVGGDFNTNQDGQFGDNVTKLMEDAGFHQSWGRTPKAARATWRGSERFQATTFDHIFTLGLGKPQAEMLTVPDETSDHWPVRIVIPAATLAKAKPLAIAD